MNTSLNTSHRHLSSHHCTVALFADAAINNIEQLIFNFVRNFIIFVRVVGGNDNDNDNIIIFIFSFPCNIVIVLFVHRHTYNCALFNSFRLLVVGETRAKRIG